MKLRVMMKNGKSCTCDFYQIPNKGDMLFIQDLEDESLEGNYIVDFLYHTSSAVTNPYPPSICVTETTNKQIKEFDDTYLSLM